MDVMPLYVGTYTDGTSEGIYRVDFDVVRGALSRPMLMAARVNPTFLAWHPTRPVMYAVSETATYDGGGTGAVAAFDVDAEGQLHLVAEVTSGGAGPCFVSVATAASHVLVANYGGGSVAALPVREDGGLLPASSVVGHAGAGPHPVRQPGPRAHAIASSPGGRWVVAADLGVDRLFVYRLDVDSGTLVDVGPLGGVATAPGAGPRHFAWHASGALMYLVNELDSTISVYDWDEARGTLAWRDTASTLPAGWSGENTAAHVVVHPSGRAVYVSNRGHDSLAHCVLDERGDITSVETYASGGRTPRHFAVEATGRFLVVANQETNALVVFSTSDELGTPVRTNAHIEVPSPSFVLMPSA